MTLFAETPLMFKKIIAEMRYYEASSVYGEFPYFVVGTHMDNAGLQKMFLENWEA
nr:chlorite dismutase family protein [Lactiplantibacillus plantarum]